MSEHLLEVLHLSKSFISRDSVGRKQSKNVISNISFALNQGEIVGIVGQSGSGKSTLAKLILQLIKADSGHVFFRRNDISRMKKKQLRKLRPEIQLIFQNSYDCMNPVMTIEKLLLEPMLQHKLYDNKKKALEKIESILFDCGIEKECLTHYPRELSGGQLQRIAIARALVLNPKIIIADEVVSALDTFTQEKILQLFLKLRKEYHLTLLFISHDLAVIRKICDRVIVMEQGKIIESGGTSSVFADPKHSCTQKMISSVFNFTYR